MRNIIKPEPNKKGFTTIEAIVVLLIIVIIGLIVIFIFPASSPTKTTSSPAASSMAKSTTSTANSLYAVLSPATVASKTVECSQPLTYASNGDPGPINCAGGKLNVLAWNALAALEPKVMTLGYGASVGQVQSAVCIDATDSSADANTKNSYAIEETTYQISALYYGWNFSTNPTNVLTGGGC
jgi:competence protein ComGC